MSGAVARRSMASLVRVRGIAVEAARARVFEALAAHEAAKLAVEKREERIAAADESARTLRAWLDTEEAARDIGRASQAALRRLAYIEEKRTLDAEALGQEEACSSAAADALAAAQAEFVRLEQREKNAQKRRTDLMARWDAIVEEAEAADADAVRRAEEPEEQRA